MYSSLGLALLGACAILLAVIAEPTSIWSVVIPLFFVTLGIGLMFSNLTAYALKHTFKHTGMATALLGTVRFSFASVIGILMGVVIHRSAAPMAITMIVLIIITAGAMMLYFKEVSQKDVTKSTNS